ncbi:MAG: hypothetical protein ACM3PS_03655 [Syntrophothermus sp.]
MPATIQELNQHFIDLWRECETSLPDLGTPYTPHAQIENEKKLHHLLDQMDQIFSNPPRSRTDGQVLQLRMTAAFRDFAGETLGITPGQLDLLPSQAFSDVSEEFVRMARAFDPTLSAEDIYQAARNAWTANGLQWLLGVSVQNTPSIFAYSLLYPYTDNYLDDATISVTDKLAFSERFHRRLAGDLLRPANAHERVIFDLVAMIEKQFSRSDDPAVFESLLDIHLAQEQSLKLMRRSAAPGEVDVIGISFAKGGTSVLADGYLTGDSFNDAQRQYMYGHGIFAQLLDDMEDVEPDSQAGRLTVYSQPAGHWSLDALANRTFHFSRQILLRLDCFKVEESVREMIRRGANLLLIDTIGRTDRYYSAAYLCELEAHSPFRFSVLNQQRNNFIRRHGSSVKLVEKVMLFQGYPEK